MSDNLETPNVNTLLQKTRKMGNLIEEKES